MHLGAGSHIGVMVIPAALALAQRDSWTGAQLLRAITGGYEAAVVLGEAVRVSGRCSAHFRPSGIVGAFGAAGAAIAGSDDDERKGEDVAANALGLAANMAAGLNEWPWAGGEEILTHMGTASRGGIASFDLAAAGIVASATALEGQDGLFAAYRGGVSPEEAEATYRKWLANTDIGTGILGVTFKPVAGCNLIQTPVAVALRLAGKLKWRIAEIEQVRIVTTTIARAYPGCDFAGPFAKVQQTKMSLQYGVAASLVFGSVDEVTYLQFDNKEVVELVRKCVIETSGAFDRSLVEYRRQPSRIEIQMKDGTETHDELVDVPWIEGVEAVEARFKREALEGGFDAGVVGEIINKCRGLDQEKNCGRLFELLAKCPMSN